MSIDLRLTVVSQAYRITAYHEWPVRVKTAGGLRPAEVGRAFFYG
jgi:hypothetical protein